MPRKKEDVVIVKLVPVFAQAAHASLTSTLLRADQILTDKERAELTLLRDAVQAGMVEYLRGPAR